MKIIRSNIFPLGANSIREIFIQICNMELLELYKNKSLGLSQMLDKYSESDIRDAFKSIYVDKDYYLSIPEHSNSDVLLRFLEFGGEGIKPTHLLSKAKQRITKTFL